MNKLLFLILGLTNVFAFAQKNNEAIKFYDMGVKAFNQQDYKTADSLFAKSAELEPHVDTYFNLASSKYKLGDYCGYCQYIDKVSKYGDIEAMKLFNSKCCIYDTTFYKNVNVDGISNYYSVVTSEKCSKNKSQCFYIKIKDSMKYSFVFIDSTYKISNITFNNFPNIDTNLNKILFYITDKMPTFIGGENKLYEFIGNNIKYPNAAKKSSIKGTVYISFIIDETGTINNVNIKKSAHPILDEEALRVVHLMKQWIPGEYKNKPVKVSFVLPIRFTLEY